MTAPSWQTASGMDRLPAHEYKRLKAVAADEQVLATMVERRLQGEPLQYIEGSAPFGELEIIVDDRVLIPRPETEGLFDVVSKLVRNPEVIVDLCTGSGALALALKREFPSAAVFATDISDRALEVAEENKLRSKLDVYLAHGDLFDPLPASLLGAVDLLVANPPYVAESEFDHLPPDVKKEPREALIAGPTGLEIIHRIGAVAARWLRPGGVVAVEIGETQAISAATSFLEIPMVVRTDLAGRDRYVVGAKP